jgi:hypothetical protein
LGVRISIFGLGLWGLRSQGRHRESSAPQHPLGVQGTDGFGWGIWDAGLSHRTRSLGFLAVSPWYNPTEANSSLRIGDVGSLTAPDCWGGVFRLEVLDWARLTFENWRY